MRAAALDSAAAGFSVFPVQPGRKLPAVKKWPTEATTDAERIRHWWARQPRYNVGVYTGQHTAGGITRHLAVLDLDRKSGADGVAELDRIATPHGGLPHTLIHETPSRGRHVFFYASRPVGTNAGAVAAGIDVRGVGGFVVGPGSTVTAGEYRVLVNAPIADCPKWLEDLLPTPGLAAGGKGKAATKLPGIDPARATARAIAYLSGLGPVGEGERNNAAYRVAAKVKDAGVDPDECVALMLEHWPCEPMLDGDELHQVVRSAYTKSANPQGADAVEALFEPVELEARKPRYKFATVSELISQPRPSWLVRGLLPAHGLGVAYGAPGSGKSFLMLDLAAAIARGTTWAGKRVRQGRVAYVGVEGAMRSRVEAYLREHQLQPDALRHLHILERQGVNLLADGAQDAKDLAADLGGGEPVALVIIDTLNRAMPGGNENASEDMGWAIRGAGIIASALACLCIYTHHSGKDASAGARGHSSLLGAADAELEVSRAPDGATRYVRATKVKDGEDGARFSFRLESVDLGPTSAHDPDAGPFERDSSCVVLDLKQADAPRGKAAPRWTPVQKNVYDALNSVLANKYARPGDDSACSVSEWQEAYYDATPLPDESDPKERAKDRDARRKNFGNARDWLVAHGLVRSVKKKGATAYRLTGDS